MATKYYTCYNCGKRFAAKGKYGYIKAKRRYVCGDCFKTQIRTQKAALKEAAAEEREATTGMRQSVGAMIAKIAAGGLFIIAALTLFLRAEIGSGATGGVVGAALIAWGYVPYHKVKRAQKAEAAATEQAQQAEANRQKKCNNCGAVTKGQFCEYCGAQLD